MQRASPIRMRPNHVFWVILQEEHSQHEHQNRADDPVLNERKPQNLDVAEDLAQLLIFHFGKRRIHHQDQANGDRNIGRARLKLIDELLDAGDEIAHRHTNRHRQENPQGQKAI